METFGQRLVFVREQRNISQKELAEKLGITPTRLNYWEKDKREPAIDMIKAIAQILEVNTDYLLGLSESQQSESKKSLNADESALRDEREKEIMRLVGTMSSEQKDFFLALLQTTVARNQGMLAVDPLLAGQAAQKSEHHDPTR